MARRGPGGATRTRGERGLSRYAVSVSGPGRSPHSGHCTTSVGNGTTGGMSIPSHSTARVVSPHFAHVLSTASAIGRLYPDALVPRDPIQGATRWATQLRGTTIDR
jgi:hypothetical protein